MQRRRGGWLGFVLLNVLLSVGIALAVVWQLGPNTPREQAPSVVTPFGILVTTTPDAAGEGTRVAQAAGATLTVVLRTVLPPASAGTTTVSLPDDVRADAQGTRRPAATVDASIAGEDVALQSTVAALPAGCILHTVAEGDTPFGIAQQYEASGFALLAANGLDEARARALQIGDVLIVPLEGCPVDALAQAAGVTASEQDFPAAAVTPTVLSVAQAATTAGTPSGTGTPADAAGTPQATRTPARPPTITLVPTAANAQIVIVGVSNPGDITAERVEIRNNGSTVNLNGWALSDGSGNTFTFPEVLLFSSGVLTVHTREGQNTPVALFWGRSQAVWDAGDAITLANANGQVQSTLRVPGR